MADGASEITPVSSDEGDSFLRELADTGAIAATADLAPGDRVDRYVVEAVLGRGGMGVVYEARDEELDRRVAIKVLRGEHVARADRRKRFLREAKAAARVVHPNVARILEMGQCDAGPFLVFEHVVGETLRARIRAGSVPFDTVLRTGREIASALAKAHEAGVVHRDLKPENVLVDKTGAAKVLDFGLAKWSTDDLGAAAGQGSDIVTVEGHVLGSPGYMSPEQALGRRTEPSTDVFSLGVVLFELATGQRPFRGDTAMEAIVATSRDEIPNPRATRPALPRAFSRLVMACLAKAPGERPTAREVERALAIIPIRDRDLRALFAAGAFGACVAVGVAVAAVARHGTGERIAPPEHELAAAPSMAAPPTDNTSALPPASATTAAPTTNSATSAAPTTNSAKTGAPPRPSTSAPARPPPTASAVTSPPSAEAPKPAPPTSTSASPRATDAPGYRERK